MEKKMESLHCSGLGFRGSGDVEGTCIIPLHHEITQAALMINFLTKSPLPTPVWLRPQKEPPQIQSKPGLEFRVAGKLVGLPYGLLALNPKPYIVPSITPL